MFADYIESKNNPKVKLISKLIRSSSERRRSELYVIEGSRLCGDAAASGVMIELLVYTKAAFEKNSDVIENIADSAKEAICVSDEVFAKMSDTVSPQGVLCVAKMTDHGECKLKPCGKYLVLHSVANPDNVGAAARSAEAFGADGMIVVGGCDIHNPKALRASMGALFRLPVISCTNDELFTLCENAHIPTFASTPRVGATPVGECDFSKGGAMLIGNEANGLPDEVIDRCNCAVTIPMKGRAESLNAAAAAAVLVYEMPK